MKLELSTAISFILALPAHRSSNEGHRQLGLRGMDLLFDYTKSEEDNCFNRAVIASILSTVRAFSVQRDIMASEWENIEKNKNSLKSLLIKLDYLSILKKDSYFSKIIYILSYIKVINMKTIGNLSFLYTIKIITMLIISLFLWEISVHVLKFSAIKTAEKITKKDKNDIWENQSMNNYKKLVKLFIDEYISIYRIYYPTSNKIYNYDISKNEEIEKLKTDLINLHFYF
ncbi:MAG: hypothetical protein N4A54_02110 [Peptostreptococcaceae bacterium]|jgi:hypothetical protein|nr:hypothetical protein [Peptostreptococcaceae bacterium]